MNNKIKLNARNKVGGATLLASIDDGRAALVFFDPQHRAVLDRQQYGNEGTRQKGRAKLRQMSVETIRFFVEEITRAMKPSGHLMLWVDKYLLLEGLWREWMPPGDALQKVDLLHWNKARTGMGRRFRCRSEYLIALQKPPVRAKGVWTDHRIDDAWVEMADRARHAHAKPIELTRRIILATTKRGELVVDPAAGGFGVLEACQITGREFLGGDPAWGEK